MVDQEISFMPIRIFNLTMTDRGVNKPISYPSNRSLPLRDLLIMPHFTAGNLFNAHFRLRRVGSDPSNLVRWKYCDVS